MGTALKVTIPPGAAVVARGVGLAFIQAGAAFFGSLGAAAVDGSVSSGDVLLSAIPTGSVFFTALMMRFGGSGPITPAKP